MNETASAHGKIETDDGYDRFESLVAARCAAAKGPLFTTDAAGLFEAYLAGIPADRRQHYDCRCCRKFIETYGGLVTIDLAGGIHPFLFNGFRDDAWPAFFGQSSMNVVQRAINTVTGKCPAKVTGVFLSSDAVWGVPWNVPGPGSKSQGRRWTHLHGANPCAFKHPRLSAEQAMAEKREDFIMLKRALAEIPLEAAVQAVRVLDADVLDRSEKTLGWAKWFLALHEGIANRARTPRVSGGQQRDNLIWLAVAQAPPGWCHVRSGILSTLLDDVIMGLSFDAIKRRWDQKLHPLVYQRPTAELSEGQVKAANAMIEHLGTAGALSRRFARVEEVMALWRPSDAPEAPTESRQGSAFDHLLKGRGVKPVELPLQAMDWDSFALGICKEMRTVEVRIACGRAPYFSMVTAANPDAPPILQWDGLAELPRNPVSWFFRHGGYTAVEVGLAPGWVKVTAICLKPCHWQSDKFAHQGGGIFFVLDGCRPQADHQGGGLFPECLKAEYHGIRAVIEAHSNAATIAGREEASACGICLSKNNPLVVRVNGQDIYNLSCKE